MAQQRIEFSKRVSGNGSRYPQLARSGRKATKVGVAIRDCGSEQSIKQRRRISLLRRKIVCLDGCCFEHRSAGEPVVALELRLFSLLLGHGALQSIPTR